MVKLSLEADKNCGFRRGICAKIQTAHSKLTDKTAKHLLAVHDLLHYIDTALGPIHAYLEDWQSENGKRRSFGLEATKQGYLDRIQWVEWMIEQYKQIDKEQKAK